MELKNATINLREPEHRLIVLEGQYQHDELEKGLEVEGVISAPQEWYRINEPKNLIESSYAHITYSLEKLFIRLTYNHSLSSIRSTITGKLEFTDVFVGFGINRKEWRIPELARFIRRNRRFFTSSEKANELYDRLLNFSGKVEKVIESNKDFRGNRREIIEKVVKSNMPEHVIINLPVFRGGYAEKRFVCEICIDESDSGYLVWFDCADLDTIVETYTKEIFEETLQQFRDQMPVIEQ